MKTCEICTTEESKYKCPTCEVPYCSIPCFKQHKESLCQKPESQQESPNVPEASKKKILLFTTIDTVSTENLEKLKDSKPLKDLLYNPHLRNLLTEIDSSTNPYRAMQAAMMEPLFLEFADECLKVIEPNFDEEESLINS